MDPFKMFEDYPSKHVVQGTHCRNVRRLTQDEHRQLVELKTHRFAKRVLPSFTLVDRIQQTLANTHDLGDVVLSCAKHAPQRDVERAIAWLHKVGAIALQ
jgi:hypothetical protein